jgi:hypothetical protein
VNRRNLDHALGALYRQGGATVKPTSNASLVDALRAMPKTSEQWDAAPGSVTFLGRTLPKDGDGCTPRYEGMIGALRLQVSLEPDHRKTWEAYLSFGVSKRHEWNVDTQSYRHLNLPTVVASSHDAKDPQAAADALKLKLGELLEAVDDAGIV